MIMNEYQTALENWVHGLVEFGESLGMACYATSKAVGAAIFFGVAMKEFERGLARKRVLKWEGVWLWD
jgi:hypothetical protein